MKQKHSHRRLRNAADGRRNCPRAGHSDRVRRRGGAQPCGRRADGAYREPLFTDFQIRTPELLERCLDVELALVEAHYDTLKRMADDYTDAARDGFHAGVGAVRAAEAGAVFFLLHLFSTSLYTAIRRLVPADEIFPRPSRRRRLIAEGLRFPADFDFFCRPRLALYHGGRRDARWGFDARR